jgi:hypothetical membrane protein
MTSAQRTYGGDAPLHTLPGSGALAHAGVVIPVWFTTLVVVQGWLQPDYSHIRMPISALAAWPTGWIQNVNFYVAGTLIVLFAYGLHHAVKPGRWGSIGVTLLAIGGLGVILAGVFPWTMVNGVPTENAPHVVGAVTAFGATGLGLLVFSRRLASDPRWRDLAAYTLGTAVAVLCLFVTVGFFAVDDGAPLHAWAGLIQRLLCFVWFTWMIVVAFRARAL